MSLFWSCIDANMSYSGPVLMRICTYSGPVLMRIYPYSGLVLMRISPYSGLYGCEYVPILVCIDVNKLLFWSCIDANNLVLYWYGYISLSGPGSSGRICPYSGPVLTINSYSGAVLLRLCSCLGSIMEIYIVFFVLDGGTRIFQCKYENLPAFHFPRRISTN